MNDKGKKQEIIPKVMRTPREVDLEITSRCNLNCRYCYYYDNPDVKYRDLSVEEWLCFFRELGDCSIMNVTIQGGEPFIRKDLKELIQGIVENRMRFSVLSNGTLINDEIAGFIANTRRCNSVQVSLDGSSPEIHDSCRGKGAFVKAVNGIRILQKHDINVSVRVTINHNNVDDLASLSEFLLEDLKLDNFSTNSAILLGSCRLNADHVMLSIEERQKAMKTMLKLSKKYKGRISASAGPLAEARHWNKMHKAHLNNAPAFSNGGYLTGCGCPQSKISIRADGVIIPCSMLAHMELGRINKDSLEHVWQNSPVLNELRTRQNIALEKFELCRECPYIPYCTGNCPGTAYSITGQVNHPCPESCFRSFLDAGGILPGKD